MSECSPLHPSCVVMMSHSHTCLSHQHTCTSHTTTSHTHLTDTALSKDISSHMEQLTHLVERMSARFVILETQLKLVEPQEQKAPPSSLTGNTTRTTPPLSENHGTKMVTVAERAASPPHHDQNTGSQPPPPLLAHSQTDTETPAKMRSILKPPSSCHVAAGRELLPSPPSSHHMAAGTVLLYTLVQLH